MQPPDTAKAVEILRQTVSSAGQIEAGARAQIALGMIAQEQGNATEAQADFATIAQRSDGIGAEAQFRLGESYKAIGNDSDAITAFLRSQSDFGGYDPWLTRALFSLAECYQSERRFDLAREEYQTILAIHHDDDFATRATALLKGLHGK